MFRSSSYSSSSSSQTSFRRVLKAPGRPIAVRTEYVTDSRTLLVVRPQGDRQSSRAYKIEDSDGVTLFTATGRKFSVRACREFWDASGLPLFELHRKMSLKNTWSVTLPGSKHANIATASAGWSVGDFKITFQNRAAVESKKEEEKILTLEVEKYGNALASFDVVDGDRKVAEIRESIPHNEKLALLPSSKKGYRPVLDVTVLPGVDLSLVSTIQTLITGARALLNYDEEDAFDLVRQIRSCDSLEDVAQSIMSRDKAPAPGELFPSGDESSTHEDQFVSTLAGRMGELMLDGSRKYIGGTSNLIFLPPGSELNEFDSTLNGLSLGRSHEYSVTRWTRVTDDEQLISHLMTMYFTWHYPFFTTIPKDLFYRDYIRGFSSQYCSSLLVNAMLALGCHFSSWKGARADPNNSATAGDHFFKEAKRLVLENDEHENAKLCTVQALALLSVREAGCGREGKGWVYSGMSFRMAFDLGLNLDSNSLGTRKLADEELDARRITFWGCFLFDKCWSNYLGRQPQLLTSQVCVPKIDILPNEEAELWSPYTDSGPSQDNTQPSRIRTVALQLAKLSEISGDLLVYFYDPSPTDKPPTKQAELKKLTEIHTRLEAWKKGLPKELEPREGQLPQVLVMHMFYQLLFIHLYRPFLRYTKSTSPLPQHVSPRKLCTQAAATISKLLRMYKRTYGFKQIVNVAVYIAHTACTIHLLNLPEKNAQRDLIHGLRNLDEMGESWLCARRTLRILDISANKWQIELPTEASSIFERTHAKWGSWGSWDQAASPSTSDESPPTVSAQLPSSARAYIPPAPGGTSIPQPGESPQNLTASASFQGNRQYSSGLSFPTSLSAMRAAHRSFTAQIPRTDAPLPEPTYLRPVPHSYGPMQTIPLTQHDAWYNGQVRAFSTDKNTASTTEASSLTDFDKSESLVEESHDWWSRNPNAILSMGAENWEQRLNPSFTGPTSNMRYDSNVLNTGQSPGPDNTSGAPQAFRYPVGVPPSLTESEQGSSISGYNNIGLPGDFQR
ncbi:hypothetical protein CNMCM6936_001358 [Aspergillus lentulus]|uniref:Xylanolytic transcriptional activator regulatory domain-containing protein n=1 Tax=Aspergillus lentulus TaxID=293939 RepID=A0AAN6BS35_ASPLE|nr:hypothetical protein CNMCM6069_001471 [Aspergillus lentulus]KAF4162987.1 hypothetical protein CNMCM6936_001358 [Aspergillus lentulus]KAF4172634.1 hypothetical protein CNMCM8060_001275 [Aspergillus lentulus]KAF4188357.1 hypothetical protein CNMCM7927_002030 [Aspergillus lentulus]KAF4196703.1 hypothetical protein CNMCM8694_004425 [Aspergillus lentulus]